MLLGIAVAAGVLYGWNIADSGLGAYYAAAVKSMSVSWRAFFYGAFDPGATITLDKLAGSFLPQALSARVLGFHPWSLALPQVIEGVVAVLVMYRVVHRFAGPVAGILACGILATTPVLVSMFGHTMEDGALIMCLVLAADCFHRGVDTGGRWGLIQAAGWMDVGFQCKMLEAWMVAPAFALGYLLTAPHPLRRRLGHLLAAGAVLVAVSLSWIMLYSLTPQDDRPYVDGTTTNNASSWCSATTASGVWASTCPGPCDPSAAGRTPLAREPTTPSGGRRSSSHPRPGPG